jgi:hypothetical protein
VDTTERKRLKDAGKAKAAAQSRALAELLSESIPVPASHPDWAMHYKVVAEAERRFRANRTQVYPRDIVGKTCLLNDVNYDWSRGFLPIDGYYISCGACGDLVPMSPSDDIQCGCGAVSISPSRKYAAIDPARVQVVKLMGKSSRSAKGGAKKWWKLW